MNRTNTADRMARKPLYLLLILVSAIARFFAEAYSRMFAKRTAPPAAVRSIAAVWYYPSDFFQASHTRMGMWQPYFEKEGIRFDSFHFGSMQEKAREYENGFWSQRYWYLIKTVWRRMKQFVKLRHYDVVWIDRWFMPHFIGSDAVFERCIRRMVPCLVVDCSDGTDYQMKPLLVKSVFNAADRITVAFKGLEDFYGQMYPNLVRFNYTIQQQGYQPRTHWHLSDKPTLGWMGSPFNFRFLKAIEGELQKVARQIPFKLIIICRHKVEMNIPGAEIEYHSYGDDYFRLIHQFDIGLCPYTVSDIGTTGKIGMKHQEFLLCAIPQVCSPAGISEHAVHEQNCLIAPEVKDWSAQLIRLLKDEPLREKLAKAGREMCLREYTFDGQWPLAKAALTVF